MCLVVNMYRRYIVIGVVFFLLIGAYFVFFDKEKINKEYENIYKKLVNKGEYNDVIDGVTLSIEEINEDNKYSYIVTLDNVTEKKDNIKVLVVDASSSRDEISHFPSFGIIENKGYSLILKGANKGEKEIKGLNLTIIDVNKIEELLIYFCSDGVEQFVKVNVSNYLD